MDWGVIGHEWAAQLLAEHVRQDQERHAYLFTGPPGVGRRTLALRFAQAINCPTPLEPGQPCRTCRTCQQIERMQHPDLFVVEKPKDRTMVSIDQIRALQHSLYLAPYEARSRVGILLHVHEASDEAMNAMLKTLEEAPRRVTLLLTADIPDSLLPTVVSRCEVMRLRPVALQRLQQHLEQAAGLPPDQARLYAQVSAGRPGFAMRLVAEKGLMTERLVWLDEGLRLFQSARRERFEVAAGFSEGKDGRENRERLRQALSVWLSFWRDMMLCTAQTETPLTNLDREVEIRQVSSHLDLETACRMVTALEKNLELLDGNVNPRLLAEVLLLDWPQI